MNRLITTIVAVCVLAHGILGCCAHSGGHAASAAGCEHGANQETSHSHETLPNSVAHDSSLENPPSGHLAMPPSEKHACQHGTCQWMTTKSLGGQDISQLTMNGLVLPSLSGQQPDLRFAAQILRGEASCWHPNTAGLRLHLAFGVLLV
jgi:hypothetical protein